MLFQRMIQQGNIEAHCNGKGTCGKCAVRFVKQAPLPTPQDRVFFTPEKLREGYRLACQLKNDVNFPFELPEKSGKTTILTDKIQSPYVSFSDKEEFVVAIDLGTTTIAMELLNSASGEILASFCKMNPQRKFGADVLSRLQASGNGHKEELAKSVKAVIEEGLISFEKIKIPTRVVLAGNTAMCHLLLEYNGESLAVAPFKPVSMEEAYLQIGNYQVVLMPQISAFVGGDIVAGIFGTRMCEEEKITLFIDLGTNGEMALGNKNRLLCTSTAAGPAFEGGISGGIIGTDVVTLVAELLEEEIIDETGLLSDDFFENGITWKGFYFTQRDIRNFQMAKAAVYGGIQILIKEYGISFDQVDQILLAGGFGYYLNIDSAIKVGLLPAFLRGKAKTVGNTSLLGAFLYAASGCDKSKLDFIHKASSMNLAENPSFQDVYIESMNLIQH